MRMGDALTRFRPVCSFMCSAETGDDRQAQNLNEGTKQMGSSPGRNQSGVLVSQTAETDSVEAPSKNGLGEGQLDMRFLWAQSAQVDEPSSREE